MKGAKLEDLIRKPKIRRLDIVVISRRADVLMDLEGV
jgi:hypothetical protein